MVLPSRLRRYFFSIVASTILLMDSSLHASELEFYTSNDGIVLNGLTFIDLVSAHRTSRIEQRLIRQNVIPERDPPSYNNGGHVYLVVDPVIRPCDDGNCGGESESFVPADTWLFQGVLANWDDDSHEECNADAPDWTPLDDVIERIDKRMSGHNRRVRFNGVELERDVYEEGRIETMHTVLNPPDTPAGPCFFPDGVNPVERQAATAGHFILIPPLEPGVHEFEHFEDGNDIRIRRYIVQDGLIGDLDRSDALDAADIDMLSAGVRDSRVDLLLDRDRNGIVNSDDRIFWVKDSANTWFGDANLDGEFNTTDFVQVFQSGRFELDVDASWADGDWNGDNRFNSSDLVTAFQDGGFELGARVDVAAVPEPSSLLLLTLGLLSVGRIRKR